MNQLIREIIDAVGEVLLGKEKQVKLALTCLFAKGHLLIEDLPGMGKTTLSQCLAQVLGLSHERVQFTSDLLPADILGVSIFDRESNRFEFHSGPVFTQVLLADEINRTTPKTQSALLEAMEERQVTVEGETRALPQPFFVIATQNPLTQAGTYPLPESQLDRFLMRISLGYPDRASERQLFNGVDPRARLKDFKPRITLEQLEAIQDKVNEVKATDQLLDYLQRVVDFTRADSSFTWGLSPRGAIALLRAAKAWALIHNRTHVVPEDLQMVMPCVVAHRVKGAHTFSKDVNASQDNALVAHIIEHVDVVKAA
ncbi:MAG: AAA family ATPase [Alteromonadaceae bacterium]|nr:MAG: AAA family ATPase [Alteromonadaceae bacterium]